jgi:prephenate dehydratase
LEIALSLSCAGEEELRDHTMRMYRHIMTSQAAAVQQLQQQEQQRKVAMAAAAAAAATTLTAGRKRQ